ncbi:MAG: phosphatidylserine synthase [Candidatus Angelobacter sp. Gp1-AA117]|nr:MAG: phosphatidylserine synthase [Candidatus Angelobacter sp. Gp1-AA117]
MVRVSGGGHGCSAAVCYIVPAHEDSNRAASKNCLRKGAGLKLIIQPGDGTAPLIKAIKKARKSVEIVIFRFNQVELEKALIDAVERGVFVHALIAFTNRGGEETLRKLEMRFLAKGITVARTADDLVRYHGKMMLIDRKELFVLAYNFTHLDMDRSRSFGIATKNRDLVQEAGKLFDCDTKRQPYKAGCAKFIVSPVNARQQLTAFLKGAKQELMIYDVKVSDRAILRVLEERYRAGVRIRVIGEIARTKELAVRRLQGMRLHARVIVRDCKTAFLGSQSLRKLELESRREVGIIVGGAKVVNAIGGIFEEDWKHSAPVKAGRKQAETQARERVARKMVKAAKKKMPVAPVVKQVVTALKKQANLPVDHKHVKKAVETEVRAALNKAVKKAAMKVVHEGGEEVH